jgi:hypothetical protein
MRDDGLFSQQVKLGNDRQFGSFRLFFDFPVFCTSRAQKKKICLERSLVCHLEYFDFLDSEKIRTRGALSDFVLQNCNHGIVLICFFFKRCNSSACIGFSAFLKSIKEPNSESFAESSEKQNSSHNRSSSRTLIAVILIAFPFHTERNSWKVEREKLEIEPGKDRPKVLDCFEINCIWSSLREPEWGRCLGVEEND